MGYDFNADSIDLCCEEITGHNNWAYLDKSDVEVFSRVLMQKKSSDRIHSIVVFYNDEEMDDA